MHKLLLKSKYFVLIEHKVKEHYFDLETTNTGRLYLTSSELNELECFFDSISCCGHAYKTKSWRFKDEEMARFAFGMVNIKFLK